MRIFNRLVIFLVIAFSISDVTLAVLGQNDISVYFIVNAMAYLVITLLYVHLNPRARGGLDALSGVIFAGFLAIVTIKVIEVLK